MESGRPESTWKKLTVNARVFVALFSSLVLALFFEQWMRVGLLLHYRNNEARKVRGINRLFRLWGRSTFWINRVALGLKLTVQGEPPRSGRCFILSNHQSSLDVPLLISLFRNQNLKFVAMEELRYGKPGVSLALRNGGCAFVAKKDLGEDLAALRRFGEGLERHDGSPVIFPEGQRTWDGSILPFSFAGTEAVRSAARLPLLPVTIEGLWEARTIKEYDRIIDARVTVRISEPVDMGDAEQQPREAYRRIEQEIRRSMDEIRRGTAR